MKHPVILFDGVCNLCNSSIQRVINNDPNSIFKFAPLQGKTAEQLIKDLEIQLDGSGSIVLIENEKYYIRSTAVLRIARRMQWPWNWCWVLMIFPRGFRDLAYKWVANNRYKWFGKQDFCMMPTEELKNRFLE